MKPTWQPPWFAGRPWYSDPSDRRCPRDAQLEALEVREPARGDRNGQRRTAIALTLQRADHDGWIVFTYAGVRSHSLASYLCDQGLGGWLRDEFSSSDAGLTLHRITWQSPLGGISQWLIEAAEVTHEWTPSA